MRTLIDKALEDIIAFIQSISKALEMERASGREDPWKRLSNIAKRFSNLIESEGLEKALLFAFSKAKIKNVSQIYEIVEEGSDKKISGEGGYWAAVVYLLLDKIYVRGNKDFLKEPDFIQILLKLTEPKRKREWLLKTKVYLDNFARITESLSRE